MALSNRGKGVPKGPAAILVHLASTNVQFTSEAKEAVSDNEEVFDELRRRFSRWVEVCKATVNELDKGRNHERNLTQSTKFSQ